MPHTSGAELQASGPSSAPLKLNGLLASNHYSLDVLCDVETTTTRNRMRSFIHGALAGSALPDGAPLYAAIRADDVDYHGYRGYVVSNCEALSQLHVGAEHWIGLSHGCMCVAKSAGNDRLYGAVGRME